MLAQPSNEGLVNDKIITKKGKTHQKKPSGKSINNYSIRKYFMAKDVVY